MLRQGEGISTKTDEIEVEILRGWNVGIEQPIGDSVWDPHDFAWQDVCLYI